MRSWLRPGSRKQSAERPTLQAKKKLVLEIKAQLEAAEMRRRNFAKMVPQHEAANHKDADAARAVEERIEPGLLPVHWYAKPLYAPAMPQSKTLEAHKMGSLSSALTEQVEGYRFENRLKTEADAIRRLLQLGLEAARGKPAHRPTPSQTS